jgi:hypothetical protein
MHEQSPLLAPGVDAFLARFLPPEVGHSHDLLYDWDDEFAFVPTEDEVRACLEAYVLLLADAVAREPLGVLFLLEANELVLAYVRRAYSRDPRLVVTATSAEGEATMRRVLTEFLWRLPFLENYDACKRVRAILDTIEAARENQEA